MPLRDFLLLSAICLVWGLNLVVSRFIVVDTPPMAYAALRFGGLALVLAPFLGRMPAQFWRLFGVAMCIGAGSFALMFWGLQTAPASAASIANQLGMPFTTILSMVFLGEVVRWRRAIGILLAFIGVIIIAWEPGESFGFTPGILLMVGSAFIGSCGLILMKSMDPISPFQMQAWVGLLSFGPLAVLSLLTEPAPMAAIMAKGWPYLAALVFSIGLVSIFAHGMFYELTKRHEMTLLSPLTLMTPLWAVLTAALLLSEPLSGKLLVGALIALAGVFIVAVRPNARMQKAPQNLPEA